MSKFKVGDEFVAKRNIGEFFTKGGTYTIQSHGWMEDHYYLNDDTGGTHHGAPLDWLEEEFAPVSGTPFRTVTRREIVPGRYGIVDVGALSASRAKVATSVEYGFTGSDQLREAAHIFNQLAEVLEENAKEAA